MIVILLIFHIIAVNRNNPETPTCRSGVASPHFGTLAQPPSPCSPFVNPSLSKGHPATTFDTENHAASPPANLNVSSIKTPKEVAADLVSVSNMGSFYIVTKGREPGIYTDW